MRNISIGRTAITRAFLLTGAAAASIAAPHVALAQDEPDDAIVESAQPAVIGNDIIVSATKRDETLQDVPVAVSVTTAETLERAEIRDIKDLQTEVPSLRVNQNQSSAQTTFTIRGFGNGANNAGIEPSVGVFVDGVYRSRITSRISDFPDIQRVEVLRGPQSTLFGKNASVGVISIVTQEPQFDFGGMVEASYGNYDQMIGKAVVTGPLSESIAASVAGGFNFRDGYIKDLGSGNDLNDRNRWFVRGQLLVEPSADFKFRLIADYDELDESCCGVILLQPSLATTAIQLLGGQQSDPNDPYADVTYNNFDAENKLKNYGISGQFDWSFGDATLTSITAWRKSDALTRQDVDFSSADLIYPFLTDIRAETFTQEVRLAAELGDRVDVLVGAFYLNDKIDQTGELRYGEDGRGYVNLLVQSLTGGAQTLGSLEQTLGALYGNPAQYVGDFYSYQSGLDEAYTLDNESISIFGQVDFEIVDGLTLTLGGNYTKDSKDFALDANSSDVFAGIDLVDAGNRAIFAQGVANQVGSVLMLGRPATQGEIQAFAVGNMAAYQMIAAGVQAQADLLDTNPAFNPFLALQPYQFMPPFLDVPNSVEPGETDDDKFTYTVRVAYDINNNLNIYATYATGFKASSINLSRDSRPFAADQGAIEGAGLDLINQSYGSRYAGPEESTVYEAGLKGNWPGISANLAVFQQEIKGFQSNIFTGSGFFLSNAGKQSTFGIEFEGMAELFDDFTLNFGITYLDPKYDDFEFSSVGDLTGTTPAGIPEISMTVGAMYEYDLANGDDIIARVSYHYESDVKVIEGLAAFRDPNDPDAAIEAADPFHRQVDELSASLAYQFDMGLVTPERIRGMAEGIREIVALKDPIGDVIAGWDRPNGLQIERVRTPLGVIGVIYESRPNVTADAGALCLKAGNAVILRGGSDSINSSSAIHACLVEGLKAAGLPQDAIQLVPTTDRAAVGEMLRGLSGNLDVIVPRGGRSLVERVQTEARVPVFAHLEGIVHVYIDRSAKLDMAVDVTLNAKMRRVGICGAAETLLVDRSVAGTHLKPILEALENAGCEIRASDEVRQLFPAAKPATDADWTTEYLAPIISVKLVDGIGGAIDHIETHSSHHTEAIVAEDARVVERFFNEVDSAILLHNASTQFADGGEFGMGAEIGIATGRMHARGPVGVEQLTSFKYRVRGSGQVRP